MMPDAIPLELRQIPQWVVWRHEPVDGRRTKVPYCSLSSHRKASSTDPVTWSSFEEALTALQAHPDLDGVGFVVTAGDPIVGIDFDDCIDDGGNVHPEVQKLIADLDTYTEVSPSGRGLRAFLRGPFRHPITGTHGGQARHPGCKKVEIYSGDRYLTVTGNHLAGTPTTVNERPPQLDQLVATLWPSSQTAHPAAAQHPSPDLSDQEILERARKAKGGSKFAALFDHGDISAYDGDDSRADSALCCLLAYWTNCDAERIERLFGISKLVRDKWTSRADYRQRTIRGAIDKVKPKLAAEARKRLPVIRAGTDMEVVVDQAEQVLREIARGLIYQRAEALVHIVTEGAGKKHRPITRAPRAPRIVVVEQAHLRELLSRSARFEVQRGGQGGAPPTYKPALPPKWVVETLAARKQWQLESLEAILETPFMRPDGTLVLAGGYDQATEVLVIPQQDLVLPPIPDAPTREDAAQALRVLEDPLCDFRFISDADRSVAISAMLTGLARMAIPGPTPLFALGATTRGSGKTLLASLITLVVTGHEAATFSPPSDADSMRKVLLALGIAGDPVVLMDNIEGAFGSAPLAMALTTCVIQDRILKHTIVARAPLRPLWLATGNNLTFQGDLARRVLPCDQDPQMENPEDRTGFRYLNLLNHVRSARGSLVAAGLTLLRAHEIASRPSHGGSRMGSFEAWDDRVRSALIWAGATDPLAGRERVRAQADTDLMILRELHEAWWDAFNVCGATVAQAIHKATTETDEPAAIVLRNILTQLDPRGGGKSFNPVAIGNRISGMAGRIVAGRRIVRAGESRGSTIWKVERVELAEGGHRG